MYVSGRFTYPFQIFARHGQKRRHPQPRFMGEAKGHNARRHGRLYPSRLARRACANSRACGRGAVPHQKRGAPCRRVRTSRFAPLCRFGRDQLHIKQDGKVRKVHNVILLPSLDAAERLSFKLETIGNIRSDGRPILSLSSKDLLSITLDVCPEAVFIPAHIWTPHFSLFGAFSGFDTIEECFKDLSPQIHALETGLSSDPLMNRRVPIFAPKTRRRGVYSAPCAARRHRPCGRRQAGRGDTPSALGPRFKDRGV